jgi:hypothetical protein
MNKRIMQTRIHKTSILLVNCYSYLQSSIYVLLINMIHHQLEKKQGQVCYKTINWLHLIVISKGTIEIEPKDCETRTSELSNLTKKHLPYKHQI